MRLVRIATLVSNHLPDLVWCVHTEDSTELGVDRFEWLTLSAVHVPKDWLWEDQSPMTAEEDICFLGRDE